MRSSRSVLGIERALRSRMNHLDRYVALAGTLALLSVGCTGTLTTEPVGPPPPPPAVAYAPPPPPPEAQPAPPPPNEDVEYVPEAPAVDIETYPTAVYGGTTVYFVGGLWYRRGPRGWARYRVEPPDLARDRAAHDRDPRWVRARRVPSRPGVTERQPNDRRPASPDGR
jgi:hypothetical protein